MDPKYIREEELITAKGEKIEFKEIKLDYFLNVKGGYKTLFVKREKNMSGIQRLRLRQILREFDFKGYLTESWVLKERFIEALDERDRIELRDVMNEALSSDHYRIKAF